MKNDQPVPLTTFLWSEISVLLLEKTLCHFFSTSSAVLAGPNPIAARVSAIDCHLRCFIDEVKFGPNFPLNTFLFSSTNDVRASVSSAFQFGFLLVCCSILTFADSCGDVTLLKFLTSFTEERGWKIREFICVAIEFLLKYFNFLRLNLVKNYT